MFKRDQLKRIARRLRLLKLAYGGYQIYRLICRPHTQGSLVAIWQSNQLLLVETSYRKGYSLPGGGIQTGESAQDAAVREVEEELGIKIDDRHLSDPWTFTEIQPGGINTVTIFAMIWEEYIASSTQYSDRSQLQIDQLEIIGTAWMSKEEALTKHLPNHLRHYLEAEIQTIDTENVIASDPANDKRQWQQFHATPNGC